MNITNKEAMFYDILEDGKAFCRLCPHNCVISEGKTGICGVRENSKGVLYTRNFEKVSSISLDPIEKKPLYRFHPNKYILSVGSVGCNLKCSFCQNHSIARAKSNEIDTCIIKSGELVNKAIELKPKGNIGIAYTYNEPSIWYEFVLETAKLAKEKGLINVLVTNGYIIQKPLVELLPYIDAMNIDLKAYNNDFYEKIAKGNMEDVKRTIEIAARKCHIEITTLIIPTLNDNPNEIEEMAKWLSSISPDIPLHLTRFFPRYKMTDKEPTPINTLTELKKIADKYLKYVYPGNV